MVWPCGRRKLLLVGYERFDTLRIDKIPFRIVEKDFACREEARLFVITQQLSRPHLTALAVSYLRGLRYVYEKQAHGGDRKSERAPEPLGRGKTAEALAIIFAVSPATIRRDAELTAAVNRIVENCGPELKDVLLGRNSRLTRGRILALSRLSKEGQRRLACRLLINGKLPRSRPDGGQPATITVPLEPKKMAQRLWRRVGRAGMLDARQALTDVLESEEHAAGRTS